MKFVWLLDVDGEISERLIANIQLLLGLLIAHVRSGNADLGSNTSHGCLGRAEGQEHIDQLSVTRASLDIIHLTQYRQEAGGVLLE